MFRPGHYGVALLLYAPVGYWLVAGGDPTGALAGTAGVVGLTMLPDWDSRLPGVSHRGPTHTLTFAALVGVGAWAAATFVGLEGRPVGPTDGRTFAAGVGVLSILAHLAADLLNPMGVPLAWPVSARRFSVATIRADNPAVNDTLFVAGTVATGVAYLAGAMLAGGTPFGPAV